MGVPGTEKMGKSSVKMDIDVDGQEWVVNPMIVHQNGKKRYFILLIFGCSFLLIKCENKSTETVYVKVTFLIRAILFSSMLLWLVIKYKILMPTFCW